MKPDIAKYQIGIRYANQLIRKAKKERDTKGYRENLGYDSYHTLQDKLSDLNLHYTTKCRVLQYFTEGCDNI